jgi:hypothetical protein
MSEHVLFRRTAVVAAAVAVATAAGAGVAGADTVNVPCTDSNQQASVMASEVTTCFSGTGASWSGHLYRPQAIWGGSYTIVVSFDGVDDPATAGPHQRVTIPEGAAAITDVQLLPA